MSVKILTVDDSKTIRLIVAKAFQPFDCTVLEAANGVEGLSVASREKPDLILLDYTMPVMDGFEALGRLRADPSLQATPVIMLTAEAGRNTVLKIANLGVRDYLIKPFKEDLLLERVGRVLTLKSKSGAGSTAKRYDDPVNLLVVDDKPAIVAQIKSGIADTPWQTSSASQEEEAMNYCKAKPVDVVLASLSLPNDGAYKLFQNLRGFAKTSVIPVLGLCVKSATAELSRAQQAGFAGCITKPIDCTELKSKVCRALKLETSYKYFHQRDGVLTLKLPRNFNQGVTQDVTEHLDRQLTATVDAGSNKLIVDLSEIESAIPSIIQLVVSATEACGKLSLKHAVIGSEAIRTECRNYEESKNWLFAGTFEEALVSLN